MRRVSILVLITRNNKWRDRRKNVRNPPTGRISPRILNSTNIFPLMVSSSFSFLVHTCKVWFSCRFSFQPIRTPTWSHLSRWSCPDYQEAKPAASPPCLIGLYVCVICVVLHYGEITTVRPTPPLFWAVIESRTPDVPLCTIKPADRFLNLFVCCGLFF